MHRQLVLASLFFLAAAPVIAQGDRAAEVRSLAGVGAFAVDVTIEGPRHLAESDILGAPVLAARVGDLLRDAHLPVSVRPEKRPNLHTHVNLMELENGLIPFSIEFEFYQSVRLRKDNTEMMAVTWNESVVGLVSQDRIPVIAESVERLAEQFAGDFNSVNQTP